MQTRSDTQHCFYAAGNDFSTLYAPLIRNGRMEQFYWKPNRQDLLAILLQMYKVHCRMTSFSTHHICRIKSFWNLSSDYPAGRARPPAAEVQGARCQLQSNQYASAADQGQLHMTTVC